MKQKRDRSFHEALKSVSVPHQIVGFWEDTNEATETSQPNFFNTVIPFEESLLQAAGPLIMQLAPEEDNRDGYAIRQMTKQLMRRSEAQNFNRVFRRRAGSIRIRTKRHRRYERGCHRSEKKG